MIRNMSQTPQPHFLARIVAAFANFTAAHGFAVNLFTVIALAAIGAAFLSGRPRLARLGVGAALVLCLADWVLIEDLGFFGGVGTDPNSMIPMALLFVVRLSRHGPGTRTPGRARRRAAQGNRSSRAHRRPAAGARPGSRGKSAAADTPAARPAQTPRTARPAGRTRAAADLLQTGLRSLATASGRSIAAAGALGVVLVGVLPSAAASANPNADPIIAQAIGGTSNAVNYPAPGFSLTDQHGSQVSLASLHGKVVLLTFFDPVCTSDCPLIGHEFAAAAPAAGRRFRPDQAGRDRAEPHLPQPGGGAGIRPPGRAQPDAQLAVHDRYAGPAQECMARLRDGRAGPAGRGDGAAQRRRLRDRPRRARPPGSSTPTRARGPRHRNRRSQ